MVTDKPRRNLLKAIGATAGLGSGPFSGIATAREGNQVRPSHSIPYDLQVINNGKSGQNIQVEFVQIGPRDEPDHVREFDIPPLNKSSSGQNQDRQPPDSPPAAETGLNLAGGTYRVVVNGPSGDSGRKTIEVPPGGLEDYSAIIVSRKPDHTYRFMHTVI